jgi:hypothetical protein
MTQIVKCRFCDGRRPVHEPSQRCRGCAMEVSDCTQLFEPRGKRPCPICDNTVVVWCSGFTRLKCIGCRNVFEPIRSEDT